MNLKEKLKIDLENTKEKNKKNNIKVEGQVKIDLIEVGRKIKIDNLKVNGEIECNIKKIDNERLKNQDNHQRKMKKIYNKQTTTK